jgi:hypothetical protein
MVPPCFDVRLRPLLRLSPKMDGLSQALIALNLFSPYPVPSLIEARRLISTNSNILPVTICNYVGLRPHVRQAGRLETKRLISHKLGVSLRGQLLLLNHFHLSRENEFGSVSKCALSEEWDPRVQDHIRRHDKLLTDLNLVNLIIH